MVAIRLATPADAAECGRICFPITVDPAAQDRRVGDLMTMGLYQEPRGAYLASVSY